MPTKPKRTIRSKPTSSPGRKTSTMKPFAQELQQSLRAAVEELRARIGNERLYAFALYTSGQDDFSYVCASANTEEGLARRAAAYASENPDYGENVGPRRLRWSAPDWEWHNFFEGVAGLQLPVAAGAARDEKVYAAFIDALRMLEQEGAFAWSQVRPTLAVMCGDMDDAFLLMSLSKLNPKPIVEAYRKEHTPGPFLDMLVRLPAAQQLEIALPLYRELALGLETTRAADARLRNVTHFDLEPLIRKLGTAATSRLLDLVEENGFGQTFNAKGSAAWKKHGAFTLEENLATSAMLLIGKGGLTPTDVGRVQALLARRVELDRAVEGPTSLLAAITARVLRTAFPRRFPTPKQNDRTNQLDNAEPFLLRG